MAEPNPEGVRAATAPVRGGSGGRRGAASGKPAHRRLATAAGIGVTEHATSAPSFPELSTTRSTRMNERSATITDHVDAASNANDEH